MNLGVKAGSTEKPSKVRVVNQDIEGSQLMKMVAKLCLSNAQGERLYRSILLVVIKIPTDSVWHTAHQQAVEGYKKQAKEMREG
eukprot:9860268-Karenia_brevis.AAC.1